MAPAWLLLVAACCAAAVDAIGGPPSAGADPRGAYVYAGEPVLPLETLAVVDNLWGLPFFRDSADPNVVVTMDDLDKVDTYAHPPLQYRVPEPFRRPDGVLTSDAEADREEAEVNEDQDDAVGDSNIRGLTDWLPHSVQNLLPHIPPLSSMLPTYIPGINFEAEVHRKPVRLPQHVFPTPSDVRIYVNAIVQTALESLHQKQQQLAELIKCSCPRPARCDAILQEFLHGAKKPSKAKPSLSTTASVSASIGAAPNAAAPTIAAPTIAAPNPPSASFSSASATSSAHHKVGASHDGPQLSFYAGLSKPTGDLGPGLGFYVDQSGPHLGHYNHQGHHGNPQHAPAPGVAAAPTASAVSVVIMPTPTVAVGVDAPASASAPASAFAPAPALPQPSEYSPPAGFVPPSNSSLLDAQLSSPHEEDQEPFKPSLPDLQGATPPSVIVKDKQND